MRNFIAAAKHRFAEWQCNRSGHRVDELCVIEVVIDPTGLTPANEIHTHICPRCLAETFSRSRQLTDTVQDVLRALGISVPDMGLSTEDQQKALIN